MAKLRALFAALCVVLTPWALQAADHFSDSPALQADFRLPSRLLLGVDLSSGEVVQKFEHVRIAKAATGQEIYIIGQGGVEQLAAVLRITPTKEGSSASVVDPLGLRTEYSWDSNGLLLTKALYTPDLYRIQRHFWGPTGQLLRVQLEDGQGRVFLIRTFKYDSVGQLIEERVFGNLTGAQEGPLIFTPQGDPDPEKNESFGRRIEYHKKRPFYPTLSEDDFGRQKRYVYNEDGRLAAQLFAYKGAIQGREFYIYDDDGNLIEQIKDDGSSEQIDDLSTVSERRMQRLIPEYIRPDRAEPTVKENFYFDRDAGLYVAAGMHVLRLSEDAQVLSEKHYDAEHVLVSASEFEYDEDGHIIQRRCNGSNQLLEYTDLGQVASILTVETGQRVDYSYDAFGRPVVEQQTFYDGSTVTTRAQFDALGHQVAEIDAFGNRTEMEYDALGRRIRQIAPAILAESGMKRPTRVWEYDIFDRVVKTSDEDGYTTEIHYSCLGLPIQIAHPDGTTETLRYHLDGTLAEHSNAQGVTRRCRYDTWGRLVEIELLGSDGAMAAYQERSYDGFRLASVLNSSGVQQRFAYDAAGRLRFLAVDDGVHSSQREYEYDPRGQLQSARDWFDYGSKDYCEAYYGTVESGQVLSILDANGRLLQQIDPNQVAKVAGPSSYDGSTSVAHMKPVLDAFNSLGQNVLAVKLTQNDGGQQESTYDAMGRLVEQVQTDAFGQVLQHREMLYDGRGNKIVEVAHGRSGEKEVRTEWIYGPRNRLEALFEAVGDATERRTEFIYDETGRLSRRILADGTALVYFYNAVGQLERLRSTDGSVDYVYSCDEQGRVTEVEDRVLQTTTQRTFDGLGNMVYERLANSCELLTEYDRTGRPRYVQLPDGSGIRYVYEGTLLRSVVRESKEGTVLYTHRYEYDLEGRLIASELPEDVGAVLYSWDRQGRLEAVDSSYWSQHIGEEGRDADGRITAMETSDPSGTLYAEYRYDSMGQLELDGSTDESRYSYDARSNRDSIDGQRCEVDALNRLLRHGQTLLAYDARGNLISEEGPDTFRRYRYDALNRMIEVESPGKERVEYRYDAFGRRLSRLAWTWDGKARAWMGGEEERYLYYEMNEIGHCNADGTWDAFRILGFGAMGEMGAAVAIELSGSVYAPIHDQQGSVRCLIDCQTKEIVEYYRYSAFGQEEIYNGDRQRITAEEALNPWRFSSKRTDTESGLVFFGHRYFAPHLGRWTSCDPMGYFESSNLYAYTLNNPLGHKDPYGLFSFSELFESVVNLGLKAISAVVNAAQSLSGIVMDHFSMLGQAGRELESTAVNLLGKTLFCVSGYYMEPTTYGTVGEGEISQEVRITYINGILNNRTDCQRAAEAISETHGGCNVHYIHSATSGFTWDLIKALMGKTGWVSTSATLLAHYWKAMIAEMGGVDSDCRIIHYAHSLGGTDTNMAKNLLTPEELAKIEVVTFGSASLITEGDFGQVMNYVSRRDGIPMTDPFTYFAFIFGGEVPNVVFVGDYQGIPLVDHFFDSPNYRGVLDQLGASFIEQYGQFI